MGKFTNINFKLSRKKFWVVTILIFLLPISINYKTLIFGKYTTGVVVDNVPVRSFLVQKEFDKIPVIEFNANNKVIRMYGIENANDSIGEKYKVAYNPNNPTNCVLVSFEYFYLGNKVILPGILLLVWLAFFQAFRDKKSESK